MNGVALLTFVFDVGGKRKRQRSEKEALVRTRLGVFETGRNGFRHPTLSE